MTTETTSDDAKSTGWRLDTANGSMAPRSALDVLVDLPDGDARERFLELGTSWFQNQDDWAAMPATDGPEDWQHIEVGVDESQVEENRVNVVAPGPIWTPLQVAGGQLPGQMGEFGQDTPLGRAGQPAELASLFVMLAADDASFSTGTSVGAHGGKGSP